MSKKIQGLTKLIQVIEKYPEALGEETASYTRDFGNRILLENVKTLFEGLPILTSWYSHYIKLGEWCSVGLYGKGEGMCQISWEDSDKIPNDEWLFQVCFSSGPFIFGQHYPQGVFKTFFSELKEYGPKYSDTHNNALYFEPQKAKIVYNALPDLLVKYKKLSDETTKEDKIRKLEEQIEALKQGKEVK